MDIACQEAPTVEKVSRTHPKENIGSFDCVESALCCKLLSIKVSKHKQRKDVANESTRESGWFRLTRCNTAVIN